MSDEKVGRINFCNAGVPIPEPTPGEIPLSVVSAAMLAGRGNGQLLQCVDDYHTNIRLGQIAKIDAAVTALSGWFEELISQLRAAKEELEPGLADYMQSRHAADPTCKLIKLPGGELEIKKNPDSVKVTVADLKPFADSIYVQTKIAYQADKNAIKKALAAGESVPFAEIEPGKEVFRYRLTAAPEGGDHE